MGKDLTIVSFERFILPETLMFSIVDRETALRERRKREYKRNLFFIQS
jgi:hypothetical protein